MLSFIQILRQKEKNLFRYYKSHLKEKTDKRFVFNDWHIMIARSTKLQKLAHDVTGAPCPGIPIDRKDGSLPIAVRL